MLCERCKAAEAVIHLTRNVGGTSTVHHYCASCARRSGGSVASFPAGPPGRAGGHPGGRGARDDRASDKPGTASLDELDRAVRLYIYHDFLLRGAPPTVTDAAAALELPDREVAASYDRLAAGRVVVLKPGTREVLMANPLSAVPTRFVARMADGRRHYGNCIWDVLGIPAMLRQDATIEARCGDDCGERMELEVRGPTLARGDGVVHFGVPAARWWADIVFT